MLVAGGLDALLALLDGACHAALLPLALSALAGARHGPPATMKY